MNRLGCHECPQHGDTLQYHDDQGDEFEQREHLECMVSGCTYEVWVFGDEVWAS